MRKGVLLSHNRITVWLIFGTFVYVLLLALALDRSERHASLSQLANLVGPTTQSMMAGRGLSVCTDAMSAAGQVICFHAARMPLADLIVGTLWRVFGDHPYPVAVVKALLLLVPLEIAIWLACAGLPVRRARRWAIAILLLAPFCCTPFLADVLNLQVEEGYVYSLLALAVALLIFRRGPREVKHGGVVDGMLFGLSVAGVYLAKSSMLPAAAVLLAVYVWQRRRAPAAAIIAAVLLLGAVGRWAVYQHAASGRFSAGTSLDGVNLHKGNNAQFLSRYPPAPGDTLDRFDGQLSAGHPFANEWVFNDFHQHAAVKFMRQHPDAVLRGDVRKVWVLLVSLRKIGSSESHGKQLWAEAIGLLIFRLMLWAAVFWSLLWCVRGTRAQRESGAAFLLLVAAVSLPYLLGFALTRHGSVLLYPSALWLCGALESHATMNETGPAHLHSA